MRELTSGLTRDEELLRELYIKMVEKCVLTALGKLNFQHHRLIIDLQSLFGLLPVLRIRIRIRRIRMFLGLPDPDPDPLVRCTDPVLLSSSKNKYKKLDSYCFLTSVFLSLQTDVNSDPHVFGPP